MKDLSFNEITSIDFTVLPEKKTISISLVFSEVFAQVFSYLFKIKIAFFYEKQFNGSIGSEK